MSESTAYTEAEIEAALAVCDSEPVHIPGAIQSFGVLIRLDKDLSSVNQVSANIDSFLGISVKESLMTSPEELLGEKIHTRLREELTDHSQLSDGLVWNYRIKNETLRFHITAYCADDSVVLELEPIEKRPDYHWLSLVNEHVKKLVNQHTKETVLKELVEAVRKITGLDRTLVLKFDENYNGRVVAESHNRESSSMLNHHFPASDIPSQVRAIYEINQLRFIANSSQEPVPLVPFSQTTSLDLSLGTLRAVSPIHRQYMRNMGVATSLSLAIYSNSGLWGLLVCHKQEAGILTPFVRDSVVTLVRVASQRLFLLQAEEEADYKDKLHQNRVVLAEEIKNNGPEHTLSEHAAEWQRLFRADGIALVYRDHTTLYGCTPTKAQLLGLADWLSEQWPELNPWSTTQLLEAGYPEAKDFNCGCCGLLAMPLLIDVTTRGWLFFFRLEQVETIDWAGNTQKVLERENGQLKLTPRHSFSVWHEEVRGKSMKWQQRELLAARDLGDDMTVLASAHEITHLNERLQFEREALARANEHFHKLAITDSLTGVMNRYRIEHLVQIAIANAERYGQYFSLILFDIDHFKHVNDTFGHHEGDCVLKTLVERLEHCLRETDQLGRWGGEEFLILASNTDLAGATELAERVRAHVATTDFGLPEPVTISLGATQWMVEDTFKTLLVRADTAMYQAKKSGRNRVYTHQN